MAPYRCIEINEHFFYWYKNDCIVDCYRSVFYIDGIDKILNGLTAGDGNIYPQKNGSRTTNRLDQQATNRGDFWTTPIKLYGERLQSRSNMI